MEAAERALFERGISRATGTCTGETLDAALDDLGWPDALAVDPSTAVSVLFEALGASNAASSALDVVLAEALGGADRRPSAVVLPRLRRSEAPGRLDADRCTVEGLGTAALSRADAAIVVATTGAGAAAFTVGTRMLEVHPVRGIDPALGLVEVTGVFDLGQATSRHSVDWDGAAGLGQLALGHELVGAGRAMLELARLHATERMQFGRPISAFQAVRHRLADSMVAVEAAAGLLTAAWDEPSASTPAMAKGLAGRSVRTVARHAQQVLAGIGFTSEHALHHYVRRTIVLDQLLGAGSSLTRQVGERVIESGALPPAFAL